MTKKVDKVKILYFFKKESYNLLLNSIEDMGLVIGIYFYLSY